MENHFPLGHDELDRVSGAAFDYRGVSVGNLSSGDFLMTFGKNMIEIGRDGSITTTTTKGHTTTTTTTVPA